MFGRKSEIGIPDGALDKHIAILGKTGSGKTNTAKVTVERLLHRKERVCVIDPTAAWWGLRVMADGKTPGFPVVVFGGEHGDVPISGMHGSTIAEVVGQSSTPAVIDTRLLSVSDRTRFFTDFAETLIRVNQGPLTLVIDEAHLFMPQGGARTGGTAPAMLHAGNNLVSLGRGLGLRIVLITQRPAKLHKDALTQVETLVAMRLIAPQDRNAIKDWIIEWAEPEEGKELIGSLPSMPTGEGVVWSPEIGMLERVKFPLAVTFDSSKAPTKKETAKLVLAPIDIEALEGRLKSVADEAKANDPKALRGEVARLTRELTNAAKNIPQNIPDPKALEEAERRGHDAGYQRGWQEGQERLAEEWAPTVNDAISEAEESIALMNDLLKGMKVPLAAPKLVAKARQPRAAVLPRPTANVAVPAQRVVAANGEYSGPQMKVLRAVAMWRALGHEAPSKEMVAAVAGYSAKSGGYANLLGSLRGAGAVDYPQPGRITLAADGIEIPTRDEGRDMLLSVLSNPQRRIVDSLLSLGQTAAKADVAAAAEYSASSGGFANLLGSLRTIGIIDYPQSGHIALSDWAIELLT